MTDKQGINHCKLEASETKHSSNKEEILLLTKVHEKAPPSFPPSPPQRIIFYNWLTILLASLHED